MASKFKLLAEVEGAQRSPTGLERSPVYVAANFKDTPPPAASELTLYQTFSSAVQKFGDNDCLGVRSVDADGEAGDYEFWSYKETEERVVKLASVMKALGIERGAKVGVFGANCREWMLVMQACNRMSWICVPIYDTLGENAVEYIVNHSESCIVFLDGVNMPKLEKALPNIKGYVKNAVFWGKVDQESAKRIKDMKIGMHEFHSLLESGAQNEVPADPPNADDLCTIMYTSGTTGDPKGVTLTHEAVASAVYSLRLFTNEHVALGPGDRYLSYLPLAHILDRMGEETILGIGAGIGYWQGSLPKLVSDISALRPTIFVGVPRVFDRIYTRVKATVESSNFIKRFLFEWGFSRKLHALREGISHDKASPFFDRLVFSKIKARLGGHVRLILTGGAPIAPHTEEFLKVCFCAPVVQGYGLTETCAGSFITIPDDPTMDGTVGPPLPLVQLCLESVPDMGYDANGDVPIGEVCIRTPASFSGYYKADAMTAEVLEKNGWFHTGDVGMITPEGSLRLVDRKKNILKLSQGEYVALEKIEGAYKESTAVEQIWVYGDSFKNFLVAVVVPTEEFATKWAATNQKGNDYNALCNDEGFKTELKAVLDAKAKEQKLKGFEAVKRIHVESEQFSVENDLITPTFKLRRPQLQKKYKAIVDGLYAESS